LTRRAKFILETSATTCSIGAWMFLTLNLTICSKSSTLMEMVYFHMKISKSQLDLFVTQLKACTSVKTKLTVRGSSHVNTIDVGQLSPFTLTSATFTGKCIRTNASFFLEQFSRKSNGTGERSSKTSETSPTEKKKIKFSSTTS
jgi:hypothetical protein